MVDEDAEMASKLNATFPGGQVPPARETSPELPVDEEDAAELIRILTEVAGAAAKAIGNGLARGWESLCLIGPSLSRIADAHEKMAAEAKIYNEAYVHDVGQKHHAVR